MIKVAVAGNFYPLHDGHIDHLEKASKLGDFLTVIIGNDEHLKRKGKPIHIPLDGRIKILKAIRYVDEVIVATDTDGTVAETLREIKPDIFAKGGDRTLETMPQSEIETCNQIGCLIIFGVGERLHRFKWMKWQ